MSARYVIAAEYRDSVGFHACLQRFSLRNAIPFSFAG